MKLIILIIIIQIFVFKVLALDLEPIPDENPSPALRSICMSKIKNFTVPNLSIEQLASGADQLKLNKQYCEAAAYYLVIMTSTLSATERGHAWLQRIESYFYEYDYDLFFLEAASFLKERPSSVESERVHYLIVKAVEENILQMPKIESLWVQCGLGIHPAQLSPDSDKNYLKFRSFLDKYPQSENASEVSGWLEQTKALFNTEYVKEARMMVLRREFAPAILRYQFLLNIGPEFSEFDSSMYELINLLADFAYSVDDPNKISSQKLARWMTLTQADINTEKRLEIKKLLLVQAKKILDLMTKKLPQSPWTQKALEDFSSIAELN